MNGTVVAFPFFAEIDIDQGSGWIVAWLSRRRDSSAHVLAEAKPTDYFSGKRGMYQDAITLCGLSTEQTGCVAQAVSSDYWGFMSEVDLKEERETGGLCKRCARRLEV